MTSGEADTRSLENTDVGHRKRRYQIIATMTAKKQRVAAEECGTA